ncbi:MAG: hypothetical protein SF053_11360 [Bacteroidia bacterium]|nr:hypothetical protein [Bacteroidia bacterium]
MRKVDKQRLSTPTGLTDPQVIQTWDKIARTGDKTLIRDTVYKDTYKDAEGKTQSRVRDKLNEVYHHKCAYCERYCKAEIEHYRPKKAVAEDPAHPGYYWLCYEWTNLLPSCRYCNTEGGKGNQFPIMGTRISAPALDAAGNPDKSTYAAHAAPLLDEQPYLLNPEIDNPDDYLTFEINPTRSGVFIHGTDPSRRGETTIRICHLNRTELALERLAILQEAYGQMLLMINFLITQGDLKDLPLALGLVFRQLYDYANDDTKTHTLLRKHLIGSAAGFRKLVAPMFSDPDTRELVILAFDARTSPS